MGMAGAVAGERCLAAVALPGAVHCTGPVASETPEPSKVTVIVGVVDDLEMTRP